MTGSDDDVNVNCTYHVNCCVQHALTSRMIILLLQNKYGVGLTVYCRHSIFCFLSFFDLHEKCVWISISVWSVLGWLAGRLSSMAQNFDIALFKDTINVITVRLFMMAPLTELCLLIPLSVTLTIPQGHSSVKQFQLKKFMCLPNKVETL